MGVWLFTKDIDYHAVEEARIYLFIYNIIPKPIKPSLAPTLSYIGKAETAFAFKPIPINQSPQSGADTNRLQTQRLQLFVFF